MTTNPVRLDRLEAGITAYLDLVLPDAVNVWSPAKRVPSPSDGDLHARASLVTGPTVRSGDVNESTFPLPLPSEAVLSVPSGIDVGNSLIAEVSGRRFVYDVQAGDDAEAARDGLLALMNPAYIDAEFVATGTDQITITPTALGDLYNVDAHGSLTVSTTDTLCAVQFDQNDCGVEIMIHSLNRYPSTGAAAAMARVLGRLRLPASRRIFESFGLTVYPGAPVDLTSLSGPEWLSKNAATLTVSMVSVAAEAVPTIQGANLNMSTDVGSISTQVSNP